MDVPMPIFAMTFSLFFVLNSLGNVPLFVGLLTKFEVKRQRQIILRELLIALFILLLFNFFGDDVLKLLGISQPVLGVAGGTLLFIIALGMIFPRPADNHESKRSEPLIVPLATPIVAGPGAITTVMVYAEQLHNVWVMSSIILLAWIPTFIILLLSSNIKYFLGKKGLLACEKLGGMLISLIAVQMICTGVTHVLQDALYIPHKESVHSIAPARSGQTSQFAQ
jgi:multiple antibiotic resistance protein